MSSATFFRKCKQEVVKVVQNQVLRISSPIYCIGVQYLERVIRKNDNTTTLTTSNTYHKEDSKYERV